MESEFPSNSKRPRPQDDEVKVEKVIQGEVVRRKKPLGKRFKETFIGGEDAKGVVGHVLYDILVPAARDMVVDAGYEALQRTFYGESRPRRGPGSRGGSAGTPFGIAHYNTPYNRYSSSSTARRPAEDPRDRQPLSRRARAAHDFDEIILETRVEADEVIDRLFDLVSQYNSAKVSDLYDLVGITGSHIDEKWGWTDLRGAGATRIKGGYLLDLPRPEPIN